MSCPKNLAALVADGDEDFARHRSECVSCRREAEAVEATLRALGPLGGALPAGDELFVASVRRGYEQSASRGRGRWRLPAFTLGLAAAAALVALLQPRPIVPRPRAPAHFERADFDDEDPCELIGDLDHDELERVDSKYGKGV